MKMKFLVVFALYLAAVQAAPLNEEVEQYIVGGVNALPNEFPHMVSLQWVILGTSSHSCGGGILNTRWVSVKKFITSF